MTKRKKIVLIILIPVVLLIAYFVMLSVITYKNFVVERMSMNIQYENGKTTFIDDSIGFSFEVHKKCHIDSDVLNQIAYHPDGGYWRGKFVCEGVDDDISFRISTYQDLWLDGFNIYEDYGRVYWMGDFSKDISNLEIVDNAKKKIFIIYGGPRNKEIWQDILTSLKEI